MAENKVRFLKGTATEYANAVKDDDTFYYTTDDEKFYIGSKEITGGGITVDDTLSDTSEHPVQNKVIKAALDGKADVYSAVQIVHLSETQTDTKVATGQAGKITIYRCVYWTDVPSAFPDGQGTLIAINYVGNGTAGTDSIWCEQFIISPRDEHRIFRRIIDGTSVGEWKDYRDGGNADTANGLVYHELGLGTYYTMTASDFSKPGIYGIGSLASGSPNVLDEDGFNVGDFKVLALNNNPTYQMVIMTSPRYTDNRAYIGRFWDNNFIGWKRISDGGNAARLESHPASDFVLKTEKGVAGGIASLGDDGKVPSEQLPTSGGVGQSTTGKKYVIDDVTYTAGNGAEIFNDYANNKAVGEFSHAEGAGPTASGFASHAEGRQTTASGSWSHAEGAGTTASGSWSHAESCQTTASGSCSHAEGSRTIASSYASHAGGKYNKAMTNSTGASNNTGDAFVIGNGTNIDARSNAFRVTYGGAVYGLSAFNSSGADYAEFIKPWADGNPDSEDRVGYMVTIKNGLLCKANEGDYIVGITSGNPSVVGNADEDYYWRYERDEFNRFVYEDAEEEVEQLDDDGTPVLDENGMPVMVKTGNIIKNAHYKLAADYDPTKQNDYIERKNRPEWSYVGMIGVIPVRDDGTCVAGDFAKCGVDGIATKADKRDFDTFFVIERINKNVISIEMR